MPDQDVPSYESQAYLDQLPDWTLVNDCFAGTRQIREQGETYLTKNAAEREDDYTARLKNANFWNAYKRTIQGLTGMVFRKSPVLSDDVPEIIKGKEIEGKSQRDGQWEDIDLAGNHGDVFVKDVFRAALNDGHTFILVDMPPALPLSDPAITKRESDRLRPYWVHVNKGDLINWRTETKDGQTRLIQATIRERVLEPAGMFVEVLVIRYLVLRIGSWERWIVEETEKKEVVAKMIDSGETLLDFIPLVPVYTNRTGFFTSSPPLLDVALENLRHYRLQSDLDTIMHVCNVPALYTTGRSSDAGPLVLGPFTATNLPEGAEMKYLEHSGKAIGAAQAEIDTCKTNIATLGLLLLQDKPQVQRTATEIATDAQAESSELASMARGLEDGVEQALKCHAAYLNLPSGGSVTVNKDFVREQLDAQKITAYSAMVTVKQLSIETMWEMLLRGEELPATFDAEIEKQRIKDATPEADQLNLQRQRLALEADKQRLSGNPPGIAERIMQEKANIQGQPPN